MHSPLAGLLVPKIGGPSVKPYQPAKVWETVAMDNSNTRFYKPDTGEGLYRRSLYTFWKRSAPPPSMDIFDAPSREECVVRRERTDTPLQALVTMDDPQFVEADRVLAQNALLVGARQCRSRDRLYGEPLTGRAASTKREQAIVASPIVTTWLTIRRRPTMRKTGERGRVETRRQLCPPRNWLP